MTIFCTIVRDEQKIREAENYKQFQEKVICTAKLFKNSNDKVGQQIYSFKGKEKKKKEREKSVNKRRKHRLDITESASAQFPTLIFNFGSYGQPRAVRENLYYDEL